MSAMFYKNRCFMTYLTADGLMDKVNRYCKRYGLSYSKLAQMSIAEKLEREEQEQLELQHDDQKGVRGSYLATNQVPTAPTAPSSTEPKTTLITKEVSGR
jgi:hypothetical protein